MNKSLLLACLIVTPSYSTKKEQPLPKTKQEIVFDAQLEKDSQEFRMKLLTTCGAITLAIIAALVRIYMTKK